MVQGDFQMTYNISALQQLALSAIAAIITASVCISAAVGPVGQFI
jgi:hypothetical protein